MRAVVIGAGAVGSLLGWAVVAGGGEAVLVGRDGPIEPEDALLVVIRPDGTRSAVKVRLARDLAALGPDPDLMILAVKQYDLPGVLDALAGRPDAAVLTVQNGVGAEELTTAARPTGPVLAGSLTASVERAADGTIHWLRSGGLGLAAVRATRPVLGLAATTFAASGLDVRRFEDAQAMKWSKLVANLVANATSALLDVDPAAIYGDARLFGVERDQLREALGVMRARGLRPVDLPGARVSLLARATGLPATLSRAALARVVGSARGGKDPSLRGAIDRGGPSEVAWLNGAVARAAVEAGIAAPVNAALAALVEGATRDADRRAWFRGRPDRLLEALGRA
jgi:2-dehydropantoate 2-reductase